MTTEHKPTISPEDREYLDRHFNEAECERLAQSNREYRESHSVSSRPHVTNEQARQPEFGPGAFRAFEVTATVYLPRGAELPTTAAEWFAMVDRMGSSLERVVERRYPLCDDVVEQRRQLGTGPVYG